MNSPIMYHVVAGYPDPEACLRLMMGMQSNSAVAIEVQIPFSDPIADGETIMQANDVALDGGMTTASSFELIEKARQEGLNTDLYIMSYLQKVRHFGLPEFCERADKCQVKGLIIPDLPYDSMEFAGLCDLTAKHQIALIPVLSPGMLKARLHALLALNPPTVYVTSKQGITGDEYDPASGLKQLVTDIRKLSKTEIMIGFGISTPDDIRGALSIGDIAVVGSGIIKVVQASGVDGAIDYIESLVSG